MFSFLSGGKSLDLPTAANALAVRADPVKVPETHFVSGARIVPPFPDGMETIIFGLGCFWGAERIFWQADGVYSTAVGYAAGVTPNPSYEEVCSGRTGHNEVVLVVYDPAKISVEALLKRYWEGHNPTQGMRQGNDVGTQYRSGIYCSTAAQKKAAEASKAVFQKSLKDAGFSAITTEILDAPEFYYAENYHQQYLAKNPAGYCGLGGTGVGCPIGIVAAAE